VPGRCPFSVGTAPVVADPFAPALGCCHLARSPWAHSRPVGRLAPAATAQSHGMVPTTPCRTAALGGGYLGRNLCRRLPLAAGSGSGASSTHRPTGATAGCPGGHAGRSAPPGRPRPVALGQPVRHPPPAVAMAGGYGQAAPLLVAHTADAAFYQRGIDEQHSDAGPSQSSTPPGRAALPIGRCRSPHHFRDITRIRHLEWCVRISWPTCPTNCAAR